MIIIFVESMSVSGKKVNQVKLNEEKINHILNLQFERDELIKYEILPKIRSVRRYQESLWWKLPVFLSSCLKDFPNDNGNDGFGGFFFPIRKNKIKIKIKWNKMNEMVETSSAFEQLSQRLSQ